MQLPHGRMALVPSMASCPCVTAWPPASMQNCGAIKGVKANVYSMLGQLAPHLQVSQFID